MIRLSVHPSQIDRCVSFAREIISKGDQYNRFSKSPRTQAVRTFIGKLGEYIFWQYLNDQDIRIPEGDLFEIYPGQSNVDDFDFVTASGASIDIKTASLPFHSRIMVPMTQFHLKKDYYVGIKLHFDLRPDDQIAVKSIKEATLYGYTTRAALDQSPTKSFGEGECKWIKLDELREISVLLALF